MGAGGAATSARPPGSGPAQGAAAANAAAASLSKRLPPLPQAPPLLPQVALSGVAVAAASVHSTSAMRRSVARTPAAGPTASTRHTRLSVAAPAGAAASPPPPPRPSSVSPPSAATSTSGRCCAWLAPRPSRRDTYYVAVPAAAAADCAAAAATAHGEGAGSRWREREADDRGGCGRWTGWGPTVSGGRGESS